MPRAFREGKTHMCVPGPRHEAVGGLTQPGDFAEPVSFERSMRHATWRHNDAPKSPPTQARNADPRVHWLLYGPHLIHI